MTDARYEEVYRLRETEKLTFDEIAERIGKDERTARRWYRRAREAREQKSEVELTSGATERVTTAEELMAAAGLDPSEWEVTQQWLGARDVVDGQRFSVTATVRRVAGSEGLQRLTSEILDALAEQAPVRPELVSKPGGKHLLVLSLADHHFGKLAWAEETGHDYDLKIAVQRWKDAVVDLLSKVQGYDFDEVVLVVGNDLSHIDTLSGTTTAGTQVETDGRYAKIYARVIEVLVWTVDMVRLMAPVKVIVVPGNHDRITAFTMGHVVDAWYRNDDRVTVDNSPQPRKYHLYGSNLLGFAHGDEEKIHDLPLIMADEVPLYWAESHTRDWMIGHQHRKRIMRFMATESHRGVRVITLPSLTGRDGWHHKKGYSDRVSSEAYVYHRDHGYTGHVATNVHEGFDQ